MMFPQPKPKRYEDTNYLEFLQGFSCCVPICSQQSGAPHHMVSIGARGSDLTAIPICHQHHMELHNSAPSKFSTKYRVNLCHVQTKMLKRYQEIGGSDG